MEHLFDGLSLTITDDPNRVGIVGIALHSNIDRANGGTARLVGLERRSPPLVVRHGMVE